MKHGRRFAQTVQNQVQTKVQTKSEALNLEAAVLALWVAVCSVCARCARVRGCVLGRVQGRVVAGRFWCSYAWVSLTQTAPARPRGCLCACTPVCTPVCAPVCACGCVHRRVRSCRRCVRCVGVVWCAVVCAVLWCVQCCGVAVLW